MRYWSDEGILIGKYPYDKEIPAYLGSNSALSEKQNENGFAIFQEFKGKV
jgi:hypothetical protein